MFFLRTYYTTYAEGNYIGVTEYEKNNMRGNAETD